MRPDYPKYRKAMELSREVVPSVNILVLQVSGYPLKNTRNPM